MTENQIKPRFSAHCVFVFTASNTSAGSGLSHHDALWIPNFIAVNAGLAEHTPHCDAAKVSELLAQKLDKAVAGKTYSMLHLAVAVTTLEIDPGNDPTRKPERAPAYFNARREYQSISSVTESLLHMLRTAFGTLRTSSDRSGSSATGGLADVP